MRPSVSADQPQDIRSTEMSREARSKLTAAQAVRMRVVPVNIENGTLVFGVNEPSPAPLLQRAVEIVAGMPARSVRVTAQSLDWALAEHYPNPVYPTESFRAVQVQGILQLKKLMGFELMFSTVGSAILAGRTRVRIRRPWRVTLESREDPNAEPIADETSADGGGDLPTLYRGFRGMLRGLAEELQDTDEAHLDIPLIFFGDRVYNCAVYLPDDEIVIDVAAARAKAEEPRTDVDERR